MKSRLTIAGILMPLFLAFYASAQISHRNLLQKFTPQQVRQWLIPKNQWHPFPQTAEVWKNKLPDSVIRRIVIAGETALNTEFKGIPAAVTLEYVRTGNRSHYEALSFAKRTQLYNLILAESVERKGRFVDQIVNGVWSICEETFWGATAHLGAQKAGAGLPDTEEPVVELFSAETASLLALTDYFIGTDLDRVSKLIRPRIYYEVNRRLLTPMTTAKYGWMGGNNPNAKLNNWAPWIMSNYMTATLLLEKDDNKRVDAIVRAMKITDQYMDGLGDDGGCDEGPSYWFAAGGATFDCLTLLDQATAGQINIFSAPFVQKMGSYVYKTHIAGSYFINVADAHPRITADGLMLYRFGKAISDPQMMAFGSWAFKSLEHSQYHNGPFQQARNLFNLLDMAEVAQANAQFEDVPDAWFSDVQLLASRTRNGLFVSAHGGDNGESHNHNDVGDFTVYADGYPVIIDVGSGTYTARTFGKSRYDLWFNTSPYHNLPTINHVPQGSTGKFTATDVKYQVDKNTTKLSMELAKAYPPSAGISSLLRAISINKNGAITLTDTYQTASPIQTLTQSFLTVCPTDVSTPGKLVFNLPNKQRITLEYSASIWHITQEKMELTTPEDQGLKGSWDNQQIWRILLTKIDGVKVDKVEYRIHK